ncbi:MAG: hypothetical protein K2Y27_21225 [Xanthobacteraceae bacterium]|nr:hypothetical protein [Xanthobacteraceae bacterium]
MKPVVFASAAMLAIPAAAPAAPNEPADQIRVELNSAESAQGRCRMSFVIENKGEAAVDSLKLDFAVFGTNGVVQRRLVAELGPLRRAKTVVKAFEIEGDCASIGSLLVNDVTACAPGDAGACLDRLVLASRLTNVRFFK